MSETGAPGAGRALARLHDHSVAKHRVFADPRGALVPIEVATAIPYAVARLFWVADVPAGQQRGAHAHHTCSQYLICVSGLVLIEVQDGTDQRVFDLRPGEALLVPPLIWATERYMTVDAVLLVLCDKPYAAEDYIHSIAEFGAVRAGSR